MKKSEIIIFIIALIVIFVFIWTINKNEPKVLLWGDTDIPCLPGGHENAELHIHTMLKITVDGVNEEIPANIGISDDCMAQVHTHDNTGKIHIESDDASKIYYLASFFKVYGKSLYRPGYSWEVTLNNKKLESPVEYPEEIVLKDGDEIVISYKSQSENSINFPKDLSTKYIHTVEWPPTYTVGGGEPVCVESGSAVKEGGITKKITIGKNTYCVTESSEGAAGSTYTTYTYLANLNASTLTLKFTLKLVQCGNYDDPQKSECLSERTKFDINKIIDDIYNSIDKA